MPVLSNKGALLLSMVLLLLVALAIVQNVSEDAPAQQQDAGRSDPFAQPAAAASDPFGDHAPQDDPFAAGGGRYDTGSEGAEGGFGGRGRGFGGELGRGGREGGFRGEPVQGRFGSRGAAYGEAAPGVATDRDQPPGRAGGILDRVLAHQHDPDATAQQEVFWAPPRSDNQRKLDETLDQPLNSAGLDFADTPLEQVVEFLRGEYGIAVQIDTAALDDLGVGMDEPVTANLRNISLRSALRLMLDPLELTTIHSNEVLLVTTQDAAESRLVVAVYPIRDIAKTSQDQLTLRDTLVSVVASDT